MKNPFTKKDKSEGVAISPALGEASSDLDQLLEQLQATKDRISKIIAAVEEREERLKQIPEEKAAINREANQYEGVKRTLDPELPSRRQEFNDQLAKLQAAERNILGETSALEIQLSAEEFSEAQVTYRIGKAKSEIWRLIAEEMVIKVQQSNMRDVFIQLWAALDQLENGKPASAVLDRAFGEDGHQFDLTTDVKMHSLKTLLAERQIGEHAIR